MKELHNVLYQCIIIIILGFLESRERKSKKHKHACPSFSRCGDPTEGLQEGRAPDAFAPVLVP